MTMIRTVETFMKRFSIEGISDTIRFTFHLLRGRRDIRYKVRTDNPEADFDVQGSMGSDGLHFVYTDPAHMPQWLARDQSLQSKISNAIKFEISK